MVQLRDQESVRIEYTPIPTGGTRERVITFLFWLAGMLAIAGIAWLAWSAL